jgi:hypothetical protein
VFERRYVAEVGVGVALIRDGNGTRSVETVLRYRGAAQAELLRALKALRAEQAATARAIAAEPARARFGWNVSTGAAAKPEQGTGHAARRPNPNECMVRPRSASAEWLAMGSARMDPACDGGGVWPLAVMEMRARRSSQPKRPRRPVGFPGLRRAVSRFSPSLRRQQSRWDQAGSTR